MVEERSGRPELSVSFHAWWEGFQPGRSFFVRALARRFQVKLVPLGRDLQLYSVFAKPELQQEPGTRPLRVWITGEPVEPTRAIFDLHFGFTPRSLLGDRWHRFPGWVMSLDFDGPPQGRHAVARLLGPRVVRPRERFCNFIYSNPTSLRAELYLRLNAQRPVDSLGRLFPGPEAPVEDKIGALERYRTTLACENVLMPGYVTEKLVDPFLAGSIPIYWGADEARQDFNPKAFVFARDFATFDDLIAHVLRLDDAREAWAEMAAEPVFPGGRLRYEHTPDFFVDRIADALERRLTTPVSDADNQRLIDARIISGQVRRKRKRWKRLRRLLGRLRGPG
jgi:hypothetical protein